MSAAVNYSAVIDEMLAAGLRPRDGVLLVDSLKTERCQVDGDRERRGWYRLSTVEIGGEPYLVGAYGIWRGTDNGKVAVRPEKKVRDRASKDQLAAMAARIRADTAKAKKQREVEAEKAAVEAQRVWRRYDASGYSEYLEAKGVAAHGLRFYRGTVLVPMMDAKGKLWGVQLIRGPQRGNKLAKQYFPKGVRTTGHFHTIGGIPNGVVLLAEGYATAATLHEATGLVAVVAFDAGNLRPVAEALVKAYPGVRVLVCADDDYRTTPNTGIEAANVTAFAVHGAVAVPQFSTERPQDRKGPTDYNDLAQLEGISTVRAQVEAAIRDAGWRLGSSARTPSTVGGGEGAREPMPSRLTVEDAVCRYWGTYGFGGKVLFDEEERRLVSLDDVRNLLPDDGWKALRNDPGWRVARDDEVGFDPTEQDPAIRCNLFGGWPTEPIEGECTILLDLLRHLCSEDENGDALYEFILRWLALPIQRPGTKMHSAVVVHGPQGTGKSRFFEAYARIYGQYGRVLGQEALEDKFNADWAEKKLFLVADEVLARQDMYHIKNRLKGFITGDTIRVNPKNVAAHNEKNAMNIVFMSNERMPLVLEQDDRRHCVIWSPPPLSEGFFAQLNAEIDAGGIPALHHYLLNLDLGDFGPHTRPPMSASKRDLINQSISSEERFVQEWRALEIEHDGAPVPFCPCLGTDLYQLYQRWCDIRGERRRRMQELIGHCNKLPGWRAGNSERTWRSLHERQFKNRKLVVPPAHAVEAAMSPLLKTGDAWAKLARAQCETNAEWYTHGFFAFQDAIGGQDAPAY